MKLWSAEEEQKMRCGRRLQGGPIPSIVGSTPAPRAVPRTRLLQQSNGMRDWVLGNRWGKGFTASYLHRCIFKLKGQKKNISVFVCSPKCKKREMKRVGFFSFIFIQAYFS